LTQRPLRHSTVSAASRPIRFPSYRAAHAAFSRPLTDFPKNRWEADARAWRATLGNLLAPEEEATRPASRKLSV
jgi:hypothetical protein